MAPSVWAQAKQLSDATNAPPPPDVWATPLDPQGAAIAAALPAKAPPSVWAPVDQLSGPVAPKVELAPQPQSPLQKVLEHQTSKLWADYDKDANPMGSANNHPGFWGKLAHGLNVAMGGVNRRGWEENGLVKNIDTTLQDQSQNDLRGAQAKNFATEDTLAPGKAQSAERLQGAEADKDEAAINQGPDLAQAYAHAVNQAIKNGADPAQDPIVQHLSDAITAIQKQSPSKGLEGVNLQDESGKPYRGNYNPATGVTTDASGKVITNPIPYEKPITVNAGGAEKTWEYANNQLNTLGKPVSDLTMRMGRLQDTLAQGTPQADALVAPELLTVMAGGQGSGMRMNESEIARIVGGRSNWESLKAAMNKWSTDPSSANSITPSQRQQIHALVNTVASKLADKQNIINDAANQMVNVEDATQQHKILAETRQKLQAVDTGSNGGTDANEPSLGKTDKADGVYQMNGKQYRVQGGNVYAH